MKSKSKKSALNPSVKKELKNKTILITHSPPRNILDEVTNGLHAGSGSIFNLVKEKQPIFHVFGHIHEAFGQAKIDNTICCNVSCLWTDWLLRGYIIDIEEKSTMKIEEEISLEAIEVPS